MRVALGRFWVERVLTGGSIELGSKQEGSGSHLGTRWWYLDEGEAWRESGSAIVMGRSRGTGGVGEEVSGVTDNFQAGQLEDAAATA